MTFVRNSFGNTAGVVTKEDATKYRAQWQAEKTSITRAKLKELSK
jgi:CBS domain containing-hemolysin-like protein